ncbi:Clavaminate synthase-like protein [Polyporus arcularius HHB13444]|uniref:Clavaminate synthase-like protein n=1 Tax=Polyporus arcularius HHB13444 TaxID=1314778 RepID=A0A5C3PC12_9APHY|nr:Clavaminate synthase-like protein [Polyporus arcularius HHB13444]
MPGLTTFPPFPDDVPTHPLLVVDYELVKAGNEAEIEKLWEAATQLGFWYLKNHGVDAEAQALLEVGRKALSLPLEEKLKYELGDEGGSFGIKTAGVQAIDADGTRDKIEFLNVSQDDALAWPEVVHRAYPDIVNAHMHSAVRPFMEKSLAVNNTLLEVLNSKLGLPPGTIASFHDPMDPSSSLSRCIRAPPCVPNEKLFIPAHTDYGSLTFLHNRTGGLQVLPPGANQWYYVKPIPGLAICNVGDALNIFSGGILRSNIHRVVPPPGEQAALERWSVGFFTRPSDNAMLRAISDKSALIAEAAAKGEPGKFETGANAKEWVMRRTGGLRYNNYKGAGGWNGWKGTEDTPLPEATKA